MKNAQLLLIYYTVLDVLTFMMFGLDKLAATREKQRIPEKVLLMLTTLGGSLGAVLSMLVFKHKIRKTGFLIYVIVCFFVHKIVYSIALFL